MTDREWDERWPGQCADLPAECRCCATKTASLLREIIAPRADALSREGFIVPAADAICHAAEVFDAVAARPGGEPWLQRPKPRQSVDVICALASAVDGLERDWDMDAFDAWWAWRNASKTLRHALDLRAMVNARGVEPATERLVADIARAELEYGANR